jgi:hypothetical protein
MNDKLSASTNTSDLPDNNAKHTLLSLFIFSARFLGYAKENNDYPFKQFDTKLKDAHGARNENEIITLYHVIGAFAVTFYHLHEQYGTILTNDFFKKAITYAIINRQDTTDEEILSETLLFNSMASNPKAWIGFFNKHIDDMQTLGMKQRCLQEKIDVVMPIKKQMKGLIQRFCITNLNDYLTLRGDDSREKFFFLNTFNKTTKLSAAGKLIRVLQGKSASFSSIERDALYDGRLSQIVKRHQSIVPKLTVIDELNDSHDFAK